MNPHFHSRSSTPSEVPVRKPRRRVLTPRSLFHGLAQELHLLTPGYARLHHAHPELGSYPTLPLLLARLTTGPRDDAMKELLAALVGIRQSTPHRLWVAILLRAFRPMLAKLWKSLFGSDSQERLALLILSFQEALGQVDPTRDPLRIAMYVRQATRRRVIVALTDEIQWGEVGFGEDADALAGALEPPRREHEHRRVLEQLLRPGELSAYVKRSHPSLTPREQARVYHKLRRCLRRVFREPPLRNDNDIPLLNPGKEEML